MQEAKGSFNGYYRSPAGNKDQFTLRQEDGQSDADFIERVAGFGTLLEAQGWTPWSAGGNDRPEQALPSQNGAGGRSGANSFEVDSIKLAAGGEHPRWVVKGGNFLKYGVTCWPETLEAAGIANKLDPLKENHPSETWLAYYTERQNDEGRWVPDKVTKLERIAVGIGGEELDKQEENL